MWAELQTMQMTYQEIIRGERPWNALGDFLNYWFAYAVDRRAELVKNSIQEPADPAPEAHRWAAFCAATVEYLCEKYHIPCPDWVQAPSYILQEKWFKGLGAQKPHVQARLIAESPEPFARRNIYCSPRAFANKYETAEQCQLQPA